MMAKILGITHYDKDGKRNYTLHFVQEFSEYEMTSGAEGLKVGTVWTQLPEADSGQAGGHKPKGASLPC